MFPKKLKLIGYWNDKLPDGSRLFDGHLSDEYARYPSPLDLVSPGWLGSEKTRLISYLKSGISFIYYFGGSPCRFLCESRMVGGEELTDGVWAWPEGLAHYVEVHNVRLPEEFVDHARGNDYQIPKEVIDTFELMETSNFVIWIFRWITSGRFRWYSRLPKKGRDKSFWIEWGKSISNER